MLQTSGKRCRLLAENLGHVGVEGRKRRFGQCCRQRGFPRFEHNQFILDRERGNAVFDRLNELADRPVDGRQLPASSGHLCHVLTPLEGHLGRECLAEGCERVRLKKPLAHGSEDARLDLLPFDTATVRAGPARPRVKAREQIMRREGKAVRALVERVSNLFLEDVHAMLRLPRPEVAITQACNFTIVSALMNFISGISVMLFEPPADRQQTGRKFQKLVADFYPWDTEPGNGITDSREGAAVLYATYRNPMAHALGFQDPEPSGPVSVTRFPGPGFSDADLEQIETSVARPVVLLRQAPTLRQIDASGAIELNAECFYWGARELVRRLTAEASLMARAESHLRPMLKH